MIKTSVTAAVAAACLLVASYAVAEASGGSEQKTMHSTNANAGMMHKPMHKKMMMHKKKTM